MNDREQGSGNQNQETDRMSRLLKRAMPSIGGDHEPSRDLWPAMLHRMDEHASHGAAGVPWFDWALGGALLAVAAMAPGAIPVILYYL